MNSIDTIALLEDLLSESGAEAFRGTAMASMLGAVRRKRRARRVRRFSALVLVLSLIAITWLQRESKPVPEPLIASSPAPYQLVSTRAFAVDRTVRTQAGDCPITRNRPDGYVVLESMDSRRFVRALDDEGLLGCFAGQTVALIYHGPGEAELVFP